MLFIYNDGLALQAVVLCLGKLELISTEAGPQDMAAARAAGANFYLVKPVRQDTLVEHVIIMCGLPA